MTDFGSASLSARFFQSSRHDVPTFAFSFLCGIALLGLGYSYSTRPHKLITASPTAVKSQRARRMEYVFTEKDITPLRDNVDAGSVSVSKILVHPIKSCKGTSVQEARFTSAGLEYDRTWCIIDAKTHKIFTARQYPKMVLISPKIVEDLTDPSNSRLEVSVPFDSGVETFSVPLRPSEETLEDWLVVDDCTVFQWVGIDGYITQPSDPELSQSLPSEILSKFFERPTHLIFKGPKIRATRPTLNFPDVSVPFKYQDGYPLLVVSEESFEGVRGMSELWHKEQSRADEEITQVIETLVLERFRPNVVFRGSGKPFAEDMWQKITIAPASAPANAISFDLVSKCTRCMLPNVDPKTGLRNMAVPSKPLAEFRKGLDPARQSDSCFGCNAIPLSSGVLRVGDVVSVQQWADV